MIKTNFKVAQVRASIIFFVLLFILLLLIGLFGFDIPKENKDLVNILLGAVIGWVGSIVSFYFGATEKSNRE